VAQSLRHFNRVCRTARALLIFLFPFSSWHVRAADGVLSVKAMRERIELQLSAFEPGMALAEIPAHSECHPNQALVLDGIRPGQNGTSVALPRFHQQRDRLYSSFVVVRKQGVDSVFVGTNRFAEFFEGVSRYDTPFPQAASKKGLQVQMLDDAIKLGVKHASLNVNLSQLVDMNGGTNSLPWPVDSETIHFRRSSIESLDRQVRTLTDAKVVVSLILLTYASGNPGLDRVLLHPRYDRTAPNRLGAFNTATADGVLYFRGCLEFLASRYSDPALYGGRVVNFILGNEVNSHWFWANMGRVTMEEFAESYLRAARIANAAIRKAASSPRLYLSLEHHWGIRYPGGAESQAFPGRPFLEYFARRAREQGDFPWHLAFHPYPEDLFEPRTWNDRSATNTEATPRITFKNLHVLPRYLERPEMRHHGEMRRIILSEQGFHTVDGTQGEAWQAAGYAYAYYKTERMPAIDAFILHRHVDHGQEGGLKLGLWTRDAAARNPATPKTTKLIYDVFRLADTPDWEKAFAFALPLIGVEHWDRLLDSSQ
jgi:hypothetical protein